MPSLTRRKKEETYATEEEEEPHFTRSQGVTEYFIIKYNYQSVDILLKMPKNNIFQINTDKKLFCKEENHRRVSTFEIRPY